MIISYFACLAITAVVILLRPQVLLLTGRGLLNFHIVFLTAFAAILIARGLHAQDFTRAAFFVMPLAISLLLRRSWIIFRYDVEQVTGIVEESMSRIRVSYRKVQDGYVLAGSGGENAGLRFTRLPIRCAILAFDNPRGWTKVRVLQNLLRKTLAGIFPRPAIQL